MSYKKERILVLITHNEDGEWTQDGCFANDRYAVCSASMTCQEAIEVMAKGICKRATEVIKNNERVVLGYDFYAEAAINALIEKLKAKRKGTW